MPRPNWTAYPRWDGAIGNNNQLDGIFNYLTAAPTSDDAKKKFAVLTADNSRLQGFDYQEFFDNKLENPNANLSAKIGSQLAVRDLNFIRKRPDYAQFKYAIAGAFLGCLNFEDFISPDVLSKLQSGVYQSWALAPKTNKSSAVTGPQDLSFQTLSDVTGDLVQRQSHFGGYPSEVITTTWLRFLYEGEGHPETLKNILGTPPMSPTNPAWNDDLVGFGNRFDDVIGEYFALPTLNQELGETNLFMDSINERNWILQQYGVTAFPKDNGPAKATCISLAQKSRNAMANFNPASTAPTLSLSAGVDKAAALAGFRQYCTECHNSAAPFPLPLGNLDSLTAYRSSEGVSIADRLTRKEMPLHSAPQPSDSLRQTMIQAVSSQQVQVVQPQVVQSQVVQPQVVQATPAPSVSDASSQNPATQKPDNRWNRLWNWFHRS